MHVLFLSLVPLGHKTFVVEGSVWVWREVEADGDVGISSVEESFANGITDDVMIGVDTLIVCFRVVSPDSVDFESGSKRL